MLLFPGNNDLTKPDVRAISYSATMFFFLLWFYYHSLLNSFNLIAYICQGYFTGDGAISGLPQFQYSNSDVYGQNRPGEIKHDDVRTVCAYISGVGLL